MIKVEGLTKRYARFVAVDRISFEVGKGQIVGFLGPNGAGKTTTMRMLTCFLPPSDGSAQVAGFDVIKDPMEVKRRIGYLPETPPLYPEMEVFDYLYFVGKLKGVPSADLPGRIKDVADRCAILDVGTKLISKLSKGYRQRVGLAQAIIHNPDVLILDEPTSGLDPKQIMETRDLIKGLAGDHTIILSTHILPEVEQTCQRAVIIARGKIVATDTVANLKNRSGAGAGVMIEVEARSGSLNAGEARELLEKIDGVTRVVAREYNESSARFEVEGGAARGDLARAIVNGGWNLNELHRLDMSLEEVFLELTGANKGSASSQPAAAEDQNAASGSDTAASAGEEVQ